jgi:hypothetical protein
VPRRALRASVRRAVLLVFPSSVLLRSFLGLLLFLLLIPGIPEVAQLKRQKNILSG